MTQDSIRYRRGYRYQLAEDYVTTTRIRPMQDIETVYISLATSGEMTTRSGYAWDGPSGPTFDTRNFLRPSVGHDVKYQLMRLGLISRAYKPIADEELREDCLADGMSRLRAWLVYRAVIRFGLYSVMPSREPVVLAAP